MGRPPRGSGAAQERVTVRLSAAEKAEILASAGGRSLAETIRDAALAVARKRLAPSRLPPLEVPGVRRQVPKGRDSLPSEIRKNARPRSTRGKPVSAEYVRKHSRG